MAENMLNLHITEIISNLDYTIDQNEENEISEKNNEIEIILKCRLCNKELSLFTSEKSIDAWLVGYPTDIFSLPINDDIRCILNFGICKTCKFHQKQDGITHIY